jgi:hypothetical protein
MSLTIKPINYKNYPECMFAMLSAFVSEEEGHYLRRAAGKVVFRSRDSDGNTYLNGLLHSYDDEPAFVSGNRREWYWNGLLHRDGDLPAVVIEGTAERWYRYGKSHRDGDLPAHIAENYQEWNKDGNIHREGDLPAIIDGTCSSWYKNNRLHRDGDLPAVLDVQADMYMWFKNGLRHRDGYEPAVIKGLRHEYWEDGVFIRCAQYIDEDGLYNDYDYEYDEQEEQQEQEEGEPEYYDYLDDDHPRYD